MNRIEPRSGIPSRPVPPTHGSGSEYITSATAPNALRVSTYYGLSTYCDLTETLNAKPSSVANGADMDCFFVRWDSKKMVEPWFRIAARDGMAGVGGGLFDKAQFGGEQTTPARHRHAFSRLGPW